MAWEDEAEAARRLRVVNLTRIMSRDRAEAIVYYGAELTRGEADQLDPRRPAARGNLDGEAALRSLGGGRMTGQWALDHLDRLDELERRSMDLELLDAYADALGVRLGGVGHEPGYPR